MTQYEINSKLFKMAHETARKTAAAAGSYMIAFTCALRDLYKMLRFDRICGVFVNKCGCRLWERNGKRRIYVNSYNVARVLENAGWEISFFKTGNVSDAKRYGEHVPNNQATKLMNYLTNSYLDLVELKWVFPWGNASRYDITLDDIVY